MCEDFPNDDAIPNEERLFRRISIEHHIVMDLGTGEPRLSSAAFNHDRLSVNLESRIADAGRQPEDCLDAYPDDLLVAVRAGVCRELQQSVSSDPTPAEDAHGIVCGRKTVKAVRNGLRRKIAEHLYGAAEWVLPAHAPGTELIRSRRLAMGLDPNPFV